MTILGSFGAFATRMTQFTHEKARVLIRIPHWDRTEDSTCWWSFVDKLTLVCAELPSDSMYTPVDSDRPLASIGWSSHLTLVDGGINPVPRSNLDARATGGRIFLGTPMADHKTVPVFDMIRMIASARILMPLARVRLSAGRTELSEPEQAMCFMAGANSIFTGDKLLTTPNPEFSEDSNMFKTLGLTGKQPFSEDPSLETVKA